MATLSRIGHRIDLLKTARNLLSLLWGVSVFVAIHGRRRPRIQIGSDSILKQDSSSGPLDRSRSSSRLPICSLL